MNDHLQTAFARWRWRRIVATGGAALLLWFALTSWYEANLYAQLDARAASASVTVLSIDPVTAAAPGGEAQRVKGAPSNLRTGQTISVVYDAAEPSHVFYASSTAGLISAASGSVTLLAGGAGAWLLVVAGWCRTPSASDRRRWASAVSRPATVTETLTEPAKGPWFTRLGRVNTFQAVVTFEDETYTIVELRGPAAMSEGTKVQTCSSGVDELVVATAEQAWWPAPAPRA